MQYLIRFLICLLLFQVSFSQNEWKKLETKNDEQSLLQWEQLKQNGKIPIPNEIKNNEVPQINFSQKSNSFNTLLIPLDNSFTTAGFPTTQRSDDGSTNIITLPFTFDFYGISYTTVYVNNNGNISFGTPFTTYSSVSFPINDYPMVAPFWADVDTRNLSSGLVYYKLEQHRFTVIWNEVGYYNKKVDKKNTFEVIVTDGLDTTIGIGNNVALSFGDMQWTTGDASGGSGGFGGTPATVGINKGDGTNYALIGRFNHAGTDYDGPSGNNDGISYLDFQTFTFYVGQASNNIAPIAQGLPSGNIYKINSDSTLSDTISFLSPETNQTTHTTVDYGDLTNFNFTSTDGNVSKIIFSYSPNVLDIGTYPLILTAIDNGLPPETTMVSLAIKIASSKGNITGNNFNDANGNGIKDANESGLQNWKIFLSQNEITIDSTLTDVSGNYYFTLLEPGNYTISQEIQNGWRQTFPSSTHLVTVVAGVTTQNINFGNVQSSSISGLNFFDANGNGIKDANENGLQNWEIFLSQNEITIDSILTDANGNYIFSNLILGNYVVSEEHQLGWRQTFPISQTYSLTISSGENITNIDFGNTNLGSISGSVFNDINGNGIKDVNEISISNQEIVLSGSINNSTFTDANGNYIFENISPATYYISQNLSQEWLQTLPQNSNYTIQLGNGEISINNNFGNFKYGKITGFKFNDLNVNGVRDLSDVVISNWKIYLSGAKVDSTLTDASGNYTFPNLIYGTYTIREEQVSGWIQKTANPSNVNVVSGTSADGKIFGNFQPFSVSGNVYEDLNGNGTKDEGEPSLSNWKVKLSGTKQDSTLTDASGNYIFQNLGVGVYSVKQIVQTGFVQTHNNPPSYSSVPGTSITNVNFGNFKKVEFSGNVFNDHNGNGIKDIEDVSLSSWEITLSGTMNKKDTTDELGNYKFTEIIHGTYNISETVKNGWIQTSPSYFNIKPTSRINIWNLDFANFELGSISGKLFNDKNGNSIFDVDELPISNSVVTLGASTHVETTTDTNGDYKFSNLIHQNYVVNQIVAQNWIQTFPENSYSVEIFSGDKIQNKNFGNFELGKIIGTVWNDKNGNSIRDEFDNGIENWKVYLLNSNSEVIDSVLTSSTGDYEIDGIVTGTYTIKEKIQSHWRQTFPENLTHSISIESGTIISNINFGNVKLSSISGIKFNDINVNSIFDEDEFGIENWKIFISQNEITIDSTFTDVNGNYVFENLDLGTYTISMEAKDEWIQTFPENSFYEITIDFGKDSSNNNFGSYHLSTIIVHKFLDVNNDLATSEDRINIVWPISIYRNDTLLMFSGDTSLVLYNLPPATYKIVQRDSMYWTQLGIIVNENENIDSTNRFIEVTIDNGTILNVNFVDKYVPDYVKYRSFALSTSFAEKPVKLKLKKGSPPPLATIANVRDTIAKSLGGLIVGIAQPKTSPYAKTVGWIKWKTGADVSKFYTSIDTGKSYPLDSIRFSGKKTKPFLKENKPAKKTYVNPLAQSMGIFRLNLEATSRGVVQSDPVGYDYRDLIFLQQGNLFNGMSLKEIGDRVDSMMTFWQNYTTEIGISVPTYDTINSILVRLNSAFSTSIDTTDITDLTYQFLTLKSEIAVTDIPFLIRNRDLKLQTFSFVRNESFPQEFSLSQNFPNPFNPNTTISFSLVDNEFVSLKIYDILGREIKTLINNEEMESGFYEIDFDANNLNSGIYFYKLTTNNFSEMKKMVLVK